MRIVNLASGSKANSTFVSFEDTKILIDIGLSERQLLERLSEIGENLGNISAVCITHEHIDHIKSLKTIAKKYDCDFYLHEKLADSLSIKEIVFKAGKLHKFCGKKFNIGKLEILPFDVSHDAIAPVGFTINVQGSSSKFGIVTDTGVVSENMKNSLSGSKIVFIESNYDELMLKNGGYPFSLKLRILSEKGHLSNQQSLDFAKYLFDNGTKCFVLSHISENNNTIEKAFFMYADYFKNRGLELDKDVFIRLSYQGKHGNNFSLNEDFNG